MPQGKNPKFWIILWHTICKGCKSFIFNGLQTSRLNAHRAFFRHRLIQYRLIQLPYPIFRVCKSFVFNSLTFRVLAFLAHVSVFCCFCQFSDYRVIDRAKNIFWIFRNIFPQDTCVGCINFNAMRQNPTIGCYGSKTRLCVFSTLCPHGEEISHCDNRIFPGSLKIEHVQNYRKIIGSRDSVEITRWNPCFSFFWKLSEVILG